MTASASDNPAFPRGRAVAKRNDLVRTGDTRVAAIMLEGGEVSPVHRHTSVTEHVVCLSGQIRLHLGAQERFVVLSPGDRQEITPGVAHNLVNPGTTPAEYLLIQHGAYDFVRCDY